VTSLSSPAHNIRERDTIENTGCQDNAGPEEELRSRLQVLQNKPGAEGGHDDGDGGRKTFENVVSILDSGCHDQPTTGLETDDGDDRSGVAIEDTEVENFRAVVVEHGGAGEQEREYPELQVPDYY